MQISSVSNNFTARSVAKNQSRPLSFSGKEKVVVDTLKKTSQKARKSGFFKKIGKAIAKGVSKAVKWAIVKPAKWVAKQCVKLAKFVAKPFKKKA